MGVGVRAVAAGADKVVVVEGGREEGRWEAPSLMVMVVLVYVLALLTWLCALSYTAMPMVHEAISRNTSQGLMV